ncbi:hypothetical protein DM02DRAFT_645152 [Periconia macrospinosa]|uniref:Zn(2)-C6 fungal-type domain-containing protein n=1 Tax=Periconia macrospinosa TaxID=97972 RepID=A0A2V1DCK1_9PLEO|nr:hypothetical protein DM02DRAFT_645152 [Periconia macrospinosa]
MTDGEETSRNPRLRLSCSRCQRRKIRCDRQYPVCGNCAKNSAACFDGDSVRLRPAPRNRVGEQTVTRLKHRITWLESIIRERLPDIDLSSEPLLSSTDDTVTGNSDSHLSPLQPQLQRQSQDLAASHLPSSVPVTQRAHEIGLISVGGNSDQRYIGPSSGYFLARLLLAGCPRSDANQGRDLSAVPPDSRSIINDLVDATQGPLPFPNSSLAHHLIQVYFDMIHPQWPLLHENSFKVTVDQLLLSETSCESRSKDPYLHFQFFMVIAISSAILSYRNNRRFPSESYCLSALQYLDQLNVHTSTQGLQCMLLLLIFTLHNPHMRVSLWHLNYQCLATVLDLGLQRNVTTQTGISRLNQEMRTRIFWTVFTLDRTIATMMGRPIGLRDEACELRLPQSVDDYHHAGPEYPLMSPTNISISIHLFRLAKLNSEIKYVANSVNRDSPSYAYSTITDIAAWQRDMLAQLNQWASNIPRQNSDNAYMEILCQIRYHSLKMLLLRPSPAIPVPSPEMLLDCYESARQTIRLYDKLYRQELLLYDWITLHGIMSCTITMLYCTRTVSSIPGKMELEDFMSDMNISLSILSATGEYWPSARRSRDSLVDLYRSIVRWIRSVKANPMRDDQRPNTSSMETTMGSIVHNPFPARNSGDQELHPEILTPLILPNDFSLESSNWQDPFTFDDITDMDGITRSLFEDFIPQVDNFTTMEGY